MSSSFYKKPTEPQSRLRQFDVGEPADMPINNIQASQLPSGYELSDAERDELQRMRRDSSREQPRLQDHARKRIEILADIGRLTKDVNVDGLVFSLRTLKSKETREATMSIFKCFNDTDASYELRRNTLARAIYAVDGQDVEAIIGGKDFDLKLELVDEMEEVIISKLYNEYLALKNEIRTKFGLESEEKVKEVVQDIKKS